MNYLKGDILKKLENYKDPNFKFNPKYHRYTYEGKKFESVTTFIQKFHRKFDSDHWSKKKAEEQGVSVKEILKEWQALNDRANEVGTFTHEWIEDYFNGIYKELPADLDMIDRVNKFNVIYAKKLYKLTPIKFEQRVFSTKWGLAGTIDSIFIYGDKIYIIDWKTNKKFTHNDHEDGKHDMLLNPFESLYKNHHTEYSIQISLYALMLEDVGIKIDDMFLCYIGPNDPAKVIRCIDVRKELKAYLNNDLF